ncbi:MAG: tetratricopeptide repeat protein [Deltaproteobacteria bacterium]|nr:tetratricopeptide repeat protein [Deltaproteobacteria bacterium]
MAINAHRPDPWAHFYLGLAYRKKNRVDGAIAEYNKALAINPSLAEVHNNLASAYYYRGNYKLAIIHCDKAVALRGRVEPKLLELLSPYR